MVEVEIQVVVVELKGGSSWNKKGVFEFNPVDFWFFNSVLLS